MKIAIGSDHAGIELKGEVLAHLKTLGHQVKDFGAFSEESVDYPDIAKPLAKAVAAKKFKYGILICGTGIGITITANKVKGVRAGVCSEPYSAKMARAHNNANIIGIGARVVGSGLAFEIAKAFLETDFEAGTRHEMRVNKINAMDGC